jgi:tetratricopeptide (TPR) repeat protein
MVVSNSKIDHDFEEALARYIDAAIAIAQNEHTSKLQPFDIYADTIRSTIQKEWRATRKNYTSGYHILLHEISKKLPKGSSLTPFIAKTNNSTLHTKGFEEFIEKGETLASLFGYTDEVLHSFYNAAYDLLEKNQFEKAFDAFFFLVTIAPNYRSCWLCYGYAALHLGDCVQAIEAYGQAYILDPQKADSYLSTAAAYLKLKEREKAIAICDMAILYAGQHKNDAWTIELTTLLNEAKRQITSQKGI